MKTINARPAQQASTTYKDSGTPITRHDDSEKAQMQIYTHTTWGAKSSINNPISAR